MNKSKRTYKINVKNPVYAILTSDTEDGVAYGDVKSLGEAQTVTVTASVASGKLYGDGAAVDSTSRLTGFSLSFDVTKIPIEARADIFNLEVQDGVVIDKANVQANQIAVGYELEQTGGTSEFVWLLKGDPKPMNSNGQQSEDNITYSTDTIEVEFVKRKFDNALRYFADTANPDFTAEQAAKWFLEGPTEPVAPETE